MANLDVGVTGLRSTKGQVLICVTADPAHFPDCGKDPAARKLAVPAAKAAELRFPDMPSGAYAVSLFHDENGNGKLDMRFGLIPLEGMGFSNNPRIRFGAPTFAAARFAITNQPIDEPVKLQYFL